MGQLSIIPDPVTGEWYRNPGVKGPTLYDVLLHYETDSEDVFQLPSGLDYLEYTLHGLDFRDAATEEDALQEAKIKLKLIQRPSILTPAQIAARDSYNAGLNFLSHAQNLIDLGAFAEGANDTSTTFNMALRRQVVQDRYNACKAVGLYFAGGPGDL